MMNMRTSVLIGMVVLLIAGWSVSGYSHCQIPCGIYDDPMRFSMLKEHITTIEKAMNEIIRLSGEEKKNMNQIVRWVTNKDDHASQFTEIITYYFMAQRISPVEDKSSEEYDKYLKKVACAHQMVVTAMKCKQTTDLENVAKLKELVEEFHMLYFGEKMEEEKKSENNHSH